MAKYSGDSACLVDIDNSDESRTDSVKRDKQANNNSAVKLRAFIFAIVPDMYYQLEKKEYI